MQVKPIPVKKIIDCCSGVRAKKDITNNARQRDNKIVQ